MSFSVLLDISLLDRHCRAVRPAAYNIRAYKKIKARIKEVVMAALAAVQQGFALRKFPPVISLPEKQRDSMMSAWVNVPSFTWAPEASNKTRRPVSVTERCCCIHK